MFRCILRHHFRRRSHAKFRQTIKLVYGCIAFPVRMERFLSADVALRNDKLVNVDILVILVFPKKRDLVTAVNYLIIAVFLAALVVYGIRLSLYHRARLSREYRLQLHLLPERSRWGCTPTRYGDVEVAGRPSTPGGAGRHA